MAPVIRVNRPIGHDRVEIAGANAAATGQRNGVIAPELRGGLFKINRFHARVKLYVGRAQFLGHKAIDFKRVAGIGAVDGYQGIKRYAVTLKRPNPGHHLIKGRFAATRDAVAVMKFPWAINRQTHQKMMFFEKFSPFIVQQNTICL
ncbi:Uncharacterised protein [Klebsiella pneumoniae]|nr:Uncharacterised protein [Klebsiella pneumoniae]